MAALESQGETEVDVSAGQVVRGTGEVRLRTGTVAPGVWRGTRTFKSITILPKNQYQNGNKRSTDSAPESETL